MKLAPRNIKNPLFMSDEDYCKQSEVTMNELYLDRWGMTFIKAWNMIDRRCTII